MTTGISPIERTHALAAVDAKGRVIIQGGIGGSQTGYAADMWIWEVGPKCESLPRICNRVSV